MKINTIARTKLGVYNMRVNFTHNDIIKSLDVARHVELKKDRLLAEKPIQEAFMTENKSQGA